MKLFRIAVTAALYIAAASANAHYLWIENANGNTMLRFGEFAENARERSPGRLDEIPGPQANIVAAKIAPAALATPVALITPVALQRRADGFAFAAGIKDTDLIAEEKNVGVRDWSSAGIGIVKPMFYARAASSANAVKPVLTLDIVPVGTSQYQLWFQNKPLAATAVTIYAPNGWWQEHKTDADGRVTLQQPWRGQYVIEAIMLEKAAGEFEGKKFDAVRHRATLTVQQSAGPATFAIAN